jgi:hypothetical protein
MTKVETTMVAFNIFLLMFIYLFIYFYFCSFPFDVVILVLLCLLFYSFLSQPHFEASVRMRLALPKSGNLESSGTLKTQSSIAGVKRPHLEVFFISLERSRSVDVENGLACAIPTSVAQVMVERRARSQIGNLTPDH